MPRLCVIGHPVGHSRSPRMQAAALAELGLAPDWTYGAVDVTPERLAEEVHRLLGDGYVGANVTIPHKEAALVLADEASQEAAAIGAANTLIFKDGRIRADNTDGVGLLQALERDPSGRRALVLGAGGAGRAAASALSRAGADVDLWNRTPERASAVASDLGVRPVGSGECDASAYELIVNSTSVGMAETASDPFKDLPIDADQLRATQTFVDLVYRAEDTELVTAAKAAGASVVDGAEILVRQGAASLRIWTGLEPPIEVMRRAALGDP